MNGGSSKGNALDGFVPRQVNGAQTLKAMVSVSVTAVSTLLIHRPWTAGKRHQPIQWKAILAAIQGYHEEEKGSSSLPTDG